MKRTVLMTGGARGLGIAIRAKFVDAGHEVYAPGREELDLANPDSLENYLQSNGDLKVDVLINNAGINHPSLIEETTPEQFQLAHQVNLSAPFRLIQNYSVGMKNRRWGRIINIGSIFSLVSRPGRGAYSSSKAGLLALTKTAALELGPFNVLVNCVCPGFMETEMTEKVNTPAQLEMLKRKVALGRLGKPSEISAVVFFLASEESSFITGQEFIVDGGFLAGLTE